MLRPPPSLFWRSLGVHGLLLSPPAARAFGAASLPFGHRSGASSAGVTFPFLSQRGGGGSSPSPVFRRPFTGSAAAAEKTTMSSGDDEDPYSFLEEVESERSLEFAREANAACLAALGDPAESGTGTYDRVLAVLESDDRIPHVRKYGRNENGEEVLFNFWKDGKNPKGLWRRTTMSSYKTSSPAWTTVLDLDALAAKDDISWVWKGSSPLPRARDPMSDGGRCVTRTLLSLSRGGADATFRKEFDLLTGDFVPEEEGAFAVPEAKTRASYKSRDVLLLGTDTGPDSVTDSGYPRQVREWVRGTPIEDAPVVFEGEKTDVSVGSYVDDQRVRGGPIYEVRYRSVTFYTSKHFVRAMKYEHLLAPDDPAREGAGEPGDFVEVDVQPDASIDFVGRWLFIALRSDWEPKGEGGRNYKSGSLLYVDAESFLSDGKESVDYNVLFEPTERTAYETYTLTKNYLILSVMDNVKSKLLFYKLGEDGRPRLVGGDDEARIRACHASAVDPYEGDDFWFTTSGYTQPSTLSLGDASVFEKGGTSTADADGGEVDDTADEGEFSDEYVTSALKSLPAMYNSEGLAVTQRTTVSEDGTEIPYFLITKTDTVLDGSTPTLLYGYGGFEVSLGPKYIASSGIAWLERGGAYVEANIRGGGEFGPHWHQQALKANRNKCYEDFIAVAEHLVSTGLCKPSTLAIRGGSNGGLLMGNMYLMRPDLFGAIHCAVPLLDMKRYHTLLAGASWMAEYGDPDTSDWDDFLNTYSPYHNIDPDVESYPPMLVTTSTRDDRVHPAHARKMVKKLWDMAAVETEGGKKRDWPVYYYENIEGGHGGAADSKQSAFMTSLAYDFMWDTLTKGRGGSSK